MAKNRITRIYKAHQSDFIKDLRRARGLEEHQVHRMRLDIKNLRALVDLLKVLSNNKYNGKAMLRLLDPVFRSAGKIRSAALSLRLSQPYRSQVLVKFRRHLKTRQLVASQEFLRELKKFNEERFRKQHKKALAGFRELRQGRIKKGAEDYLRTLFAYIRADIFDIGNDETLHMIRKRLKSIRNIGHLLEEIETTHPFKEELRKVNRTYDKIGAWHDTLELVESLEDYVDDLDDPNALEKTAPLILALKKRCLLNKRQIEKKLKADLVM